MKKTQILIFTFLFAAIAVVLSFLLINNIKGSIAEKARIKEVEKQIVHHLKFIREAQLLHNGRDGAYAQDFKALKNFIKNESIYIINKKLIPVDGDSSYYEYDTLRTMSVKDTLLKGEFANMDVEKAFYIPGKEKEMFKMRVREIKSINEDTVFTIEVSDTVPLINPKRVNPLKFGDVDKVSTDGNWRY